MTDEEKLELAKSVSTRTIASTLEVLVVINDILIYKTILEKMGRDANIIIDEEYIEKVVNWKTIYGII